MHVSETCCSNFCSQGVEGASELRTRFLVVGGVIRTIVPQDAAKIEYWELTVAGVEKMVIREAGRHILKKVVERRDERTGIA